MMNENLTTLQAFNSMRLFLEKYYKETGSDDVGALLSDMLFLEDGKTADPAIWKEWIDCVNQALDKNEQKKLLILE